MTRLKHLYQSNHSTKSSIKSLDILYDFIIVTLASLTTIGFIVNSKEAATSQKVFMVFNAFLLTTHWIVSVIFKQRYEKPGVFFRINTIFSMLALGLMALGTDLFAFLLNNDARDIPFLNASAMLLWIIGLVASRLVTFVNYLLAWWANAASRALFWINIAKIVSRGLVVSLALLYLGLFLMFDDETIRTTLAFIFLPIFAAIELLGNVLFVTNKNLALVTPISVNNIKERYAKVIIMFISSTFVSGVVHFTFYFKGSQNWSMIGNFVAIYTIAFLIWWSYVDRSNRYNLKNHARAINFYGLSATFMVASLALVGGGLINSYNDVNASYIVPAIYFGLAFFVLVMNISLKLFEAPRDTEHLHKKDKLSLVYQTLPFLVIWLVMGMLSLSGVWLPIWVLYLVVILTLGLLNIASRLKIAYLKRPLI